MRLALTILLIALLATAAPAKPKGVAGKVVDDLAAERYDAVISRLSPSLAKQLDADGLRGAWEAHLALYGAFRRRRGIAVSTTEANGARYTVADVTCDGEIAEFRVRVTLDARERIGGLFFLPPLARIRR